MKVEEIKPYGDGHGDKTVQVQEMFDNIAPAYDFMNTAMTFGMDRSWRRKAARFLGPRAYYRSVLDVGCGTGDMPIMLASMHGTPSITGVDLSEGMLAIARRKWAASGLPGHAEFLTGNAMEFDPQRHPSGAYDAVISAFCVRNFADLRRGLAEMHRVTKPGGAIVILELSTPTSPLVRPFYSLFARHIIPWMGRLKSSDSSAYAYLPESVAAVPQGAEMLSLLRSVGYVKASAHPQFFGVATIYHAFKPGTLTPDWNL